MSTENLVGSVSLPVLSFDIAGSTTFVDIAELIADPTPNDPSRDSVDLTNTDSATGTRKFTGGWLEEGEWGFLFNYREDSYTQLLTTKGVDGINWKLTWTDPGDTTTDPDITFIGFVTAGPTLAMPLEDRQTIALTIKVVETQTFTAGTTV